MARDERAWCGADPPGVVYAYAPSRGGAHGEKLLEGFSGSITCAEARRHGIAPVPRSHPTYRYMRDADGDGVVCE